MLIRSRSTKATSTKEDATPVLRGEHVVVQGQVFGLLEQQIFTSQKSIFKPYNLSLTFCHISDFGIQCQHWQRTSRRKIHFQHQCFGLLRMQMLRTHPSMRPIILQRITIGSEVGVEKNMFAVDAVCIYFFTFYVCCGCSLYLSHYLLLYSVFNEDIKFLGGGNCYVASTWLSRARCSGYYSRSSLHRKASSYHTTFCSCSVTVVLHAS